MLQEQIENIKKKAENLTIAIKENNKDRVPSGSFFDVFFDVPLPHIDIDTGRWRFNPVYAEWIWDWNVLGLIPRDRDLQLVGYIALDNDSDPRTGMEFAGLPGVNVVVEAVFTGYYPFEPPHGDARITVCDLDTGERKPLFPADSFFDVFVHIETTELQEPGVGIHENVGDRVQIMVPADNLGPLAGEVPSVIVWEDPISVVSDNVIFIMETTPPPAPWLSISSRTGKPGDNILIEGGNFPTESFFDVFVTLSLGGTEVEIARASLDNWGNFAASFLVPNVPPGDYYLTAMDNEGNSVFLMFTVVPAYDFGDAPDPTYPSLLASDGARHMDITRAWLGDNVDAETDADVPDLDLYDDGLIGIDYATGSYYVVVTNNDWPDSLYINILMDGNKDGDWDEPDEWVVINAMVSVPMGTSQTVIVTGPPPVENTWVRVTLTGVEIPAPPPWTGKGSFHLGETEDYFFPAKPRVDLDFGDAPDPTYPSLLASDGTRHENITRAWLGDNVDAEADANVPDLDLYDDGLISIDPVTGWITFKVTNNDWPSELYFNVLCDGNRDGDWDEPDEWVVINMPISLPPGASATFMTSAPLVDNTWIRMTLTGAPMPTIPPWTGKGYFDIGETEDYFIPSRPIHGVDVMVWPRYQSGNPCENLYYYVVVRNLGNVADNFALSFIPDGWPDISIEPARLENVPPGENRVARLTVHVPENAVPCQLKEITVIAESGSLLAVDNDMVYAHRKRALPKLENLYKVSWDVALWAPYVWDFEVVGPTLPQLWLKAEFRKHDGTLEGENVVWYFDDDPFVALFENVPHPLGKAVERVALVIVDNKDNVVQTVANFVVTRSVLWDRLLGIKGRWLFAGGPERDALWSEIIGIKNKWLFAPA